MVRAIVASLLVLSLAGCIQSDAPSDDGPTEPVLVPAVGSRPWAVVADGYGAPNFYHEVHRRPNWTEHPSTRIPGFPADAIALNLTLGDDFDANVEADKATWDNLEPGLYWVPGTNIIYDFHSVYPGETNGYENGLHATAVAGVISSHCPDCYLAAIRSNDADEAGGVQIAVDQHPWIDVVVQTTGTGDGREFPAPTRELYESGRLFFGPAGNNPYNGACYSYDTEDGPQCEGGEGDPPWIVAVGGAYEQCHAVESTAATPTEIVGDFIQRVPHNRSVERMVYQLGTSFSAPAAAAIAAQALHDLRAMHPGSPLQGDYWTGDPADGMLDDGRLTNAELRAALHEAAVQWTPEQYDGPSCPINPGVQAVPAPPQPWTKMGHGWIGLGSAESVLNAILNGPQKEVGDDEQAWYDAYQQYREDRYGSMPDS